MKFIHCADIHLNSKINELPTEKSAIIKEESLSAFERLCEYAVKNDVTAVIIVGDMFDTGKVSVKTAERVLHAVSSTSKIDFLYLCGNHDEDFFKDYSGELPENFKRFSDEWSQFRYGNTVISAIELNDKNDAFIYDSLTLNESDLNIVALHGQTVNYKSTTAASVISLPKLKDKFIDYLALGHIHSYVKEKLDARGVYAYSGCLSPRGFDETGDKGFVLLNCEGKKISSEFVKFNARNFCVKEYDVSGEKSWLKIRDEIMRDLKNTESENSIIKVELKGSHGVETPIDKDGLTLSLLKEFFFVKVCDKTKIIVNAIDFETDKSVVGEFVRAVQASDLTEDEKGKIIMCGLNALKGDE